MTAMEPSTTPTPAQLLRAAEIVLSRPAMAGVAAATSPERYAAEQEGMLRRLWDGSSALRRTVGALDGDRAVPSSSSAVPGARRPNTEERQVQRLKGQLAEAKERARLYRGRAERAQDEVNALRTRLEESGERSREAEETAATVAMERDILSARANDPVRALRTVHRALRSAAAARSSDPRESAAPGTDILRAHPSVRPLLELIESAGGDREGLLKTLDALLVPDLPRAVPAGPVETSVVTGPRVVPLGGGTEIGGSCLLVELGDTRVLVDAGIRNDDRTDHVAPRLLDTELASGPPVTAVVVTHAHNDHGGWVPAVVRRWPGARVLCSSATAELLPLMWQDTAQLMRRRADERRRWGERSADAPYGRAEVNAASRAIEDLPFGFRVPIGDLDIELFPAGHILGSAGVVVRGAGRRIVVSGDVSVERQLGAEPLSLPVTTEETNLLVMESTCCDALHMSREAMVEDLVRSVREVCENGGRVLIPATALGRAQEIALTLSSRLPDLPVLIDGLAGNVAETYGRHAETTAAERAVLSDRVRRVKDRRAEQLTFRQGVVVSTAGTLRGGPAVIWARDILPDPANALFICGYQDEDAPGRRLLELADGSGTLDLPDGPVEVRAAVRQFQLGAHADRRGLLRVIDEVQPQEIMLVHGREEAQRRFRRLLRERGDSPVDTAAWSPARS
ncbi:MBL fold metallo-hydrolase [Streptomyces botrytidirepellens]|uniref:MBL fold metallo-hydrolase n=2 Tax=Streptomyces botrytidirepellens TaxID=2486417 RepID=A0A3M8WRH3_9ACTN|nr:MBL fold metallo-hydrolase [Streptomyces botrytidirepellens]